MAGCPARPIGFFILQRDPPGVSVRLLMNAHFPAALLSFLAFALVPTGSAEAAEREGRQPLRRTVVSIVGEDFYINGKPTYAGRKWNGKPIEGLLLNSRMVQGIFDDRNPDTISRWAYPDTKRWDADRNTREFINAMTLWRQHGLLAFTLNLQGGSPEGYSANQPWHNSAINTDGSLDPSYMARLEKILDRADELGMAVILGYFYFGQDERIKDEAAVIRAVDAATHWVLDRGYRNVLIEVNNECNVRYDHDILKPDRVHELITRVKNISRQGRRLLAGTSYGGGTIPGDRVVTASDFVLLHGNGVSDPKRITEMVRKVRALPAYWAKPILFNEDDHFNFDKPENNFVAAVNEHASWGFFDFRMKDEPFPEGYQSVPASWGLSSSRKQGFFQLLSTITGINSGNARISPAAPSSSALAKSAKRIGETSVTGISYQGWEDSYLLSNGKVEAIVVPAVGRVMQFRQIGQESPFWENKPLSGRAPDSNSVEWINFGGDKTWPSPQADWPKVTPRGWPPPVAFDSMPVTARVDGISLILSSPVDPHFGIRTERRIELDPTRPVMKITTRYFRVSGTPRRVGVWIITQLKDPAGVFIPLPLPLKFVEGFNRQSADLPANLKVENGLISLTRDPKKSTKIGSDSGSILWVGDKVILRIDSPRVAGAEYPDEGSSVEVYTNSDPAQYVELEALGPLNSMGPGSEIEQVNTYTLLPRTGVSPEAEARKVYGR